MYVQMYMYADVHVGSGDLPLVLCWLLPHPPHPPMVMLDIGHMGSHGVTWGHMGSRILVEGCSSSRVFLTTGRSQHQQIPHHSWEGDPRPC